MTKECLVCKNGKEVMGRVIIYKTPHGEKLDKVHRVCEDCLARIIKYIEESYHD